jgi:two-component system response regulator HydG
MSGSVLLVDDDDDTRELLAAALERRGHKVKALGNSTAALDHARVGEVDTAVVDVRLGDESGIDLSQRLLEIHPELPIIVVTGHGSMDIAVQALRAGAYDFIAKPVNVEELSHAVGRAVEHRQLSTEVRTLRRQVAAARGPRGVVGDSAAIRRVHELINQVADSDASVLVTGESGTGKELVAKALHEHGPRKDKPFIAINCAAMPATLLESELFGHVRGAFTDAKRDRPGLFVQASGGTLFLDEVGEMPLEMQVKLLRVLQERRVRPVGGDDEIPFDARLVTATNRDLETEVDEGRFRADLFYRINVVHIAVPPLRARQGDVLLLAHHFLTRHAERNGKPVVGLSPGAARKLSDYDWPGNVRELENCMERAVALTRLSEIPVDDLPEKVRQHQNTNLVIAGNDPEEMITLEEVERRYVARVLAACSGNKTRAAQVLGLDRRTLYRRLDSLGIKS